MTDRLYFTPPLPTSPIPGPIKLWGESNTLHFIDKMGETVQIREPLRESEIAAAVAFFSNEYDAQYQINNESDTESGVFGSMPLKPDSGGTPYRAGDKVRFKDCHDNCRNYSGHIIPVGTVMEVVEVLMYPINLRVINPIPLFCDTVPFLYVPIKDIELFGPHVCHCPPENFRFNGIGCRCGGT
jgi:hypothetical protein